MEESTVLQGVAMGLHVKSAHRVIQIEKSLFIPLNLKKLFFHNVIKLLDAQIIFISTLVVVIYSCKKIYTYIETTL